MEPIRTDAYTEFQEVIDDRLEKVVQDFNEFRERMTRSGSIGAVNLEDLIDLYINNGGENLHSMQQNTQGQATTLLENVKKSECTLPLHQMESKHEHSIHGFDINRQIQEKNTMIQETLLENIKKSESTLPLHQMESKHEYNIHGFDINRQIQESDTMIQEMTEDTSQIDTGSFLEFSQNLDVNPDVEMVSSSIRVMHIRYGDLNCHEAAYNIIGCVFGGNSSIMRFFGNPGVGGTSFWPHVGMKESGDRITRTENAKRKYREIIGTEKKTAQPMKKTKINNRGNY